MAFGDFATIKATVVKRSRKLYTKVPVTVVYNGNTYSGGKSINSEQKEYSEEGFNFVYEFTVHLIEQDLLDNDDTPKPEEDITADGVAYVIADSRLDNFGATRRLDIKGTFE